MAKLTDYEAFVLQVRALRTKHGLSFADAARQARASDPELATRVLETVGSWPSSEPEIRALQALPVR